MNPAICQIVPTKDHPDLLRRIQPAGSPARFEARVSDNHHHLVCRSCGQVADVDCVAGSAPCLDPVVDLGFEVDEAEVLYWGRCAECAASEHQDGTSAGLPPAARDEHRPGAPAIR